MLAIRMQRTGRKGHAMFRVVVQDSHRTPTSGKVVAQLGHYDPHAKTLTVDKQKASFYLSNGAQPSDRAARLFKNNGIDLPSWVKSVADKNKTTRNPEKLRKNQPAEEVVEDSKDESTADTPTKETTDTSVEETPSKDASADEAPKED